MPTYSYIARTTEGTMERSTITADSLEHAREKLRKKQLFVEELQEEGDGKKNVNFASATMPWTNTDDDTKKKKTNATHEAPTDETYVPLVDTLRLFAGWLLAWYALVYLLGSYQMRGSLPFDIPIVEGLFQSSLVLRFAFGNFLFLLLTDIHKRWGGIASGIILTLIGVVLFGLFHWWA